MFTKTLYTDLVILDWWESNFLSVFCVQHFILLRWWKSNVVMHTMECVANARWIKKNEHTTSYWGCVLFLKKSHIFNLVTWRWIIGNDITRREIYTVRRVEVSQFPPFAEVMISVEGDWPSNAPSNASYLNICPAWFMKSESINQVVIY